MCDKEEAVGETGDSSILSEDVWLGLAGTITLDFREGDLPVASSAS